jgi:catechol 2,3-dioxygenase-like lactoylglutathione lyase family enzyme
MRTLLFALSMAVSLALGAAPALEAQTQDLSAPGFHHLHLLTTDPEAAIAWYLDQFGSASRTSWEGMPAIVSPNDVLLVFTRVDAPPLTSPQTAIWHWGWHVTDTRASLADYLRRGVSLAPLYTGDGDSTVYVSSDSWPGPRGSIARTMAQIADAKAQNIQPTGGGGFAYLNGPDGAYVEYQGDMRVERFNHVHMYYDDPRCATLWYRVHLNVPASRGSRGGGPGEAISEADCRIDNDYTRSWPALEREGTVRTATGGAMFDDVAVIGYVKQTPTPLESTLGHTADHIGLSVTNLDAWVTKLRRENVRILKEPYRVGDTRAVMIEGPSRVALELIEVR